MYDTCRHTCNTAYGITGANAVCMMKACASEVDYSANIHIALCAWGAKGSEVHGGTS